MFNIVFEKESIINDILPKENNNKDNIYKYLIFIKKKESILKILIIICSIIFFIMNVAYLYSKINIDLDNRINSEIEDDISFSEYSSTIKPIALYNPKDYEINNSLINIKKPIYTYDIDVKKLEDQINLAKSHGIYGFGFYYFWPHDKKISNSPLDIIIENKQLDLKFFLIWEPDLTDGEKGDDNKNFNVTKFFVDIKKYVMDERYIKFQNNRPIIGINNKDIEENDIDMLRDKFRENNIGEIFILLNVNDDNLIRNTSLIKNSLDGIYYSTRIDSLERIMFGYNGTFGYFYTNLLYHNINLNITNNFSYIFRTSIPFANYPKYIKEKKVYIYGDYSQEKFYFLNKAIINWTLENHDIDNQYIFIDKFSYLEKNNILGYANINTFSKSLYGIPLINANKFNLINLQKNTLVLVQAHVYYIDLLDEVVNKSNNMPVPFDLYITTNTEEKKNLIEDYLKKNSRANKYEILITENKGRDIIPLLKQLKEIWYNYKYFCHIHTKKHGLSEEEGSYWQNYLYNNLLGDKNSISQILTDFENNNKLGVIFPEHFFTKIKFSLFLRHYNRKHMIYLLDTLFPSLNIKIGELFNFPVGNMFWARMNAVYQIFDEKIIEKSPEENGQYDGTLLHGIERIWLYLAKINGFVYKCVLNYI